ncbi:hypothetical protein [Roseiarcus sp.]|uniref:hypothetical protein n=1 Tax=Roseiarcus sp. TaxID=1969460 RepID=UPI003F9B6630
MFRPVFPDADGHFDYLPEGTLEFAEAHVFGAARFALDVWERYFGRRIEWHFAQDYRRLEIGILPGLNNAYAGYGFMEVGAHRFPDGSHAPYALNFDVVAHELGHLILYSTVGLPTAATQQGEYFGFQESGADTTALIAALHFESLLERLLAETRGNLYTYNELDRFAELSPHDQIRLASNDSKMSDFAAGWIDEHALSQPLTGAIFDVFVDIFQEILVEHGLVPRDIAELTRDVRSQPQNAQIIQVAFDAAFADRYEDFRAALVEARDAMGFMLAETWKRLSADYFTYLAVAETMIEIEGAMSGGRYRRALVESFAWREIGRVSAGPRLAPPGPLSHSHSARTLVPGIQDQLPKMSYRERVLFAGIAP